AHLPAESPVQILLRHHADVAALDEQDFVALLEPGALRGQPRGDLPQKDATVVLLAQDGADRPARRAAGQDAAAQGHAAEAHPLLRRAPRRTAQAAPHREAMARAPRGEVSSGTPR